MKKLLLSLLALLMLVGCSSKGTEANTSNTDSANTETQTVTEVQEIDVEALSAGEIYQAIIDNAEGIIDEGFPTLVMEQEYNDGEEQYIPLAVNSDEIGVASGIFTGGIPLGSLIEFYAEGCNSEDLYNVPSIMVMKIKDDYKIEVEEQFVNLVNKLYGHVQDNIDTFKEIKVDKFIEIEKDFIENSAVYKNGNIIIACFAPNGVEVLSQSLNNVERMFTGE